MKRNFYIIGHNPNSLETSIQCLQDGANALEPDVHSIDGVFYVGEKSAGNALLLKDYLLNLASALSQKQYDLQKILFDAKDCNCTLVDLLKIIRPTFSDAFQNITIIITRSQLKDAEKKFFAAAKNFLKENEWLGVDESTSAKDVNDFFSNIGIKNFTYGNGISAPLIPTTLYKGKVREAINLRDSGRSFSIVYAWTVNARTSMRSYLDIGVDGLITDNIRRLKSLIEDEYADTYQIA